MKSMLDVRTVSTPILDCPDNKLMEDGWVVEEVSLFSFVCIKRDTRQPQTLLYFRL